MKVNLFRRSSRYLLVVIVLAISAAVVNADHGSVPPLHQFTAGTTAKASEVNENFKYLEERAWDRTLPATDLFYMGGNVGIGTMTPGEELDVVGDINFTGMLKQNGNPFTGGGVWTPSGSDISYSGGKVGIGTTSPTNQLSILQTVTDTTQIALGRLNLGSWSVGTHSEIAWLDSGGGVAAIRVEPDASGDWNMHLLTTTAGGGGYTTQMTVTDDGNVGIGTTSPNEKLHVAGNLRLNDGRAEIWAHDRNHMIVLRGLQDGTLQDSNSYYQFGGTLAQGEGHRFFTGGVIENQTEKMRISNDGIFMAGNVGLGTASPEGPLHVITTQQKNTLSDGIGFLKGLGGNDYQLQINAVGGLPHIDLANSADEDYDIRLAVFNDNQLAILGGNVDIGTTSPNDALDVVGDIETTGCLKYDAGTLGNCESDIRLKKNITYFADSLGKISSLLPARFEWRSEEYPDLNLHSSSQTGLIAQDLEKVFPHLVKTDENGFKKVSYGLELQMHMIQAIKELKVENEVLVKKNESLETESNEMKAKLAKFAQMEARMAKFEAALDKLETLTAAR